MAPIVRRIRNFFRSVRSSITNTCVKKDKKRVKSQDAYYHEVSCDENRSVKLLSCRVLDESSKEKIASVTYLKEKDSVSIDTKPNTSQSLSSSSNNVKCEENKEESKSEDSKHTQITDEDTKRKDVVCQNEVKIVEKEINEEASHESSSKEDSSILRSHLNDLKERIAKTCGSPSSASYPTTQYPNILPPSEAKVSPNEDELYAFDILCDKTKDVRSLVKTAETPDVVVKVGKKNEFPATKKLLCDHSRYFNERLAFNKENFCTIKVKEECVNPKAFKYILRFLCFNRPLTCHNLTTEVIRTATYLKVSHVIGDTQLLLYNRIGWVQNALAKMVLINEIRTQLETIPTMDNPVKNAKVIIKGQKGNLKAKHMKKLSNLKYIRQQKESYFYRTAMKDTLDGTIFEQLAMRPHVVVEDSENLTLYVYNVFKQNFKDAFFVDSETYKQSMQASLQLCTVFLALRFEEVALGHDFLRLNKDQIKMLLQQDVLGARSEMVVYLAALKWLRFNFEERKQFTEEVLSCVRFNQMSKREIFALYQPPILEDMMRMPIIHDLIDEELLKQESSSKDPPFKPRTLLLQDKPLILKERSASERRVEYI